MEGERNNKRENGEEGKEKAGRERVKARENLEEPLKKKNSPWKKVINAFKKSQVGTSIDLFRAPKRYIILLNSKKFNKINISNSKY